jgi:hypothetical protein
MTINTTHIQHICKLVAVSCRPKSRLFTWEYSFFKFMAKKLSHYFVFLLLLDPWSDIPRSETNIPDPELWFGSREEWPGLCGGCCGGRGDLRDSPAPPPGAQAPSGTKKMYPYRRQTKLASEKYPPPTVMIDIEGIPQSTYRGSSYRWGRCQSYIVIDMVWLNRSPIPWGEGGGGFFNCSNDFYLPSHRLEGVNTPAPPPPPPVASFGFQTNGFDPSLNLRTRIVFQS